MTPVRWLSIKYRDFYDIPRMFVVEDSGGTFLFDCTFDEREDNYSDNYVVYRLTINNGEAIDRIRDWRSLPAQGIRIGAVKTSTVQFDETKRKFVGAQILDRLS